MRRLGAGEFGDEGFAAIEGEAVDAVQHDAIADKGDRGEPEQQQGRKPGLVQQVPEQEGKRADAHYRGLHPEAGKGGGAGGALFSESAEIEFFRRVDRKQVADHDVHRSGEEDSGDCGERVVERGRAIEEADHDPDENHFEGKDRRVDQILREHDFAETHGRDKIELNADAVSAEIIVDRFVSIRRA